MNFGIANMILFFFIGTKPISIIAKSAEDLNKLTNNLQELISKFKINAEHEEKETHYSVRKNGKLIINK